MMHLAVFLMLLCLSGSGPVKASVQTKAEPPRNEKPMFKGVELYSWKDAGSGEWCFSLLPGTNRNKAYREVTDPLHTIKGVESLKKALAVLAEGEQVFWFNSIETRQPAGIPPLKFPPEEMKKELNDYCRILRVYLHYPEPRSE